MKYCILVLLSCIFYLQSAAQNKFLGTYQYSAELTNIDGTAKLNGGTYTLWFSQTETWGELKVGKAIVPQLLFSQLQKQGFDSAQIRKMAAPKEDTVFRGFQHTILATNEYCNISEWMKETGEESFIVKDTLPDIDWTLLNETKKIDTFTCQKAVGRFRGRTWYAWYAKQIPIPTGPWKLHGLPGIILEAADSLNEVKFIFKSLNIPAEKQPNIPDYSKFNVYNRQGYKEKERKKENGFKAFLMTAKNSEEVLQKTEESRRKYGARPLELEQ